MIVVEMGNSEPVIAYHEEIDPRDYGADELKQMATEAGLDAMGKKEELAARLSGRIKFRRQDERPTETRIEKPEDMSVIDFVNEIIKAEKGVWAHHSGLAEPPAGTNERINVRPTWVHAYDDAEGQTEEAKMTAMILSDHFRVSKGKPKDVEETHYTQSGPPGVGPKGLIEKKGSSK